MEMRSKKREERPAYLPGALEIHSFPWLRWGGSRVQGPVDQIGIDRSGGGKDFPEEFGAGH